MEPDEAEPPRPSAGRRALEGVRTQGRALRRELLGGTGAAPLLRRLTATRRPSFVPATEQVVIDERRHPVALALPAARTVAGLLTVLTLGALPVVLLALSTTGWAAGRLHRGLRSSLTVAGVTVVGVLLLVVLSHAVLCAVLLLLWAAEDVADWHSDRLVVTDKRVYRRYGVLTRHSPSVSLTAVAYIDAAVPPLGRLLHYGTLLLDSAAQRDAPLSRFDLVPDVVAVSHELLRLRSQAMPKFPQQLL